MPEALLAFGHSSARENAQLQRALATYEKAAQAERVDPLVGFLTKHPDSAWRQSLWLNLGSLYYQQGYFSRAIDAWHRSWESAKSATAFNQRAVADQAFGELVRMHARLGHADEVQALLSEFGDRKAIGSASEAVQGAREALMLMHDEPEIAYLCGPSALRSLLTLEPNQQRQNAMLAEVQSGKRGISLADVGTLASKAGMGLVPAQRMAGSDIPVPSVVHWRLNHYAAIVGQSDGKYHIKDPTFGDDLWVSADAINAETSGYFMVSSDRIGHGWRNVSQSEGARVYGMGATTSSDNRANREYDDKTCCEANAPGSALGMPTYAVHSMLVSLNFVDIPVGYAPPRGPAVQFKLTYNQREAFQPTTFTSSNVGLKWTHSWFGYINDNPATAGASVSLNVPGGGRETYAGYNSATGAFTAEKTTGAQLVRVSGTPIVYERRFTDGAVHVYRTSDGAAVSPRRVFLTEVRDPAGNALTLGYDGQLRLISVTDAVGQVTTLSYGDAATPLRITRVTDPFGRFADLGYDANGRLNLITDAIGMTTTFTYDAATFITGMTTPYGTTGFAYGESGTTRWLEATDPLGATERVEYRHAAPGIAASDSPAPTGVTYRNEYLNYRNTFYWDKDAQARAPGDYTQARIKHWVHDATTNTMTSPILESTKVPGETRVWMTYAGQTNSLYAGTLGVPSNVFRVVDVGTTTQVLQTRLDKYAYNSSSLVTQAIDSQNRELDYEYDTNGLDLLRIKRKNGAAFDVLAQYTYNTQHAPLTFIDAAGQMTTFTYNGAGQRLTTTNPLGQVTTNVYDASGYLTQVKNASNVVQASYTYDSIGRVRTATDSEGYVLTYDYDALDRLTRTTYPDGTYESVTYDKLDVAQSRDRLGRVTIYTHNVRRQLTQTDAPLPRTTTQQWTPAGRQTGLVDGESHPINWEYDIVGRRTAEVYADATRKTYAYDISGRLKSVTDALGQVKTLTYTKDDRVARFDYSNAANATPSVTFAYDAIHPRLTTMTDGIGSTTYAYAAVGSLGALHVLREDGPYAANDVVAYSYDALGRRATRTIGATFASGSLSGGQLESMNYDVLGRLSTKTNALATFGYSYLGQTGQLTQRTVAASGLKLTPAMQMVYDGNSNDRRLLQIRYASSPAALPSELLQDYNYDYDALGRPTFAQEIAYGSGGAVTSDKRWDIGHDNADRLLTSAPATGSAAGTAWFEYGYDRADNRGAAYLNGTNQTATYNALNQATQVDTTAYSYDLNGNLLSDGVRTYAWD